MGSCSQTRQLQVTIVQHFSTQWPPLSVLLPEFWLQEVKLPVVLVGSEHATPSKPWSTALTWLVEYPPARGASSTSACQCSTLWLKPRLRSTLTPPSSTYPHQALPLPLWRLWRRRSPSSSASPRVSPSRTWSR